MFEKVRPDQIDGQRHMRTFVGLLLALVVAMTGLVFTGAPAQAASGGGCRDSSHIRSCISWGGGAVTSDFYLLSSDSSAVYAEVEIVTTNVGTWRSSRFTMRLGRNGPWSRNVTTLPPSSGSAFTRVKVYTHAGVEHYWADSWRVYYP